MSGPGGDDAVLVHRLSRGRSWAPCGAFALLRAVAARSLLKAVVTHRGERQGDESGLDPAALSRGGPSASAVPASAAGSHQRFAAGEAPRTWDKGEAHDSPRRSAGRQASAVARSSAVARRGSTSPRSRRATPCSDRPVRSASSACVRPARRRSLRTALSLCCATVTPLVGLALGSAVRRKGAALRQRTVTSDCTGVNGGDYERHRSAPVPPLRSKFSTALRA
jgi:hypothetical protein